MRRLVRWVFNCLAAASLLLCLATAVLWVRSYWVRDDFDAVRPAVPDYEYNLALIRYGCSVTSNEGFFYGWIGCSDPPRDQPAPPWNFRLSQMAADSPELLPRFEFATGRETSEGHAFNMWHWLVPTWSLVLAFAVLPTIVAFRQIRAVRRRRRRSRLGLCPACGYDLRATPDRCPECGREA
jgi:hypothetical protein